MQEKLEKQLNKRLRNDCSLMIQAAYTYLVTLKQKNPARVLFSQFKSASSQWFPKNLQDFFYWQYITFPQNAFPVEFFPSNIFKNHGNTE